MLAGQGGELAFELDRLGAELDAFSMAVGEVSQVRSVCPGVTPAQLRASYELIRVGAAILDTIRGRVREHAWYECSG